MNARDLERLFLLERRQDPRQAASEHRLADAWRAAEQHVVPSGGGELECAPRALLSTDVCKVERRMSRTPVGGDELGCVDLAAEIGDSLGQVTHAHGLHAGKGRLRARLVRADEPFEPGAAGALRHAEHAADASQAAVERKLAARRVLVEPLARYLSRRREQGQRDRQVEARALLLQLGRREVDGRFVPRPLESRRLDAAAHALFRLLTGAIDEADERERRNAALDVSFDLDPARLQADEGESDCACEHTSRLRGTSARLCADFGRIQRVRATSTSSKNSPARRPVRRFTWRRSRSSRVRPARSRISG